VSPFHGYLTVRSFFAMISRHMVMDQTPGFLGPLKQLVNGWLFLQIWYYIISFDKSPILWLEYIMINHGNKLIIPYYGSRLWYRIPDYNHGWYNISFCGCIPFPGLHIIPTRPQHFSTRPKGLPTAPNFSKGTLTKRPASETAAGATETTQFYDSVSWLTPMNIH
jgi:hypothetical protein